MPRASGWPASTCPPTPEVPPQQDGLTPGGDGGVSASLLEVGGIDDDAALPIATSAGTRAAAVGADVPGATVRRIVVCVERQW